MARFQEKFLLFHKRKNEMNGVSFAIGVGRRFKEPGLKAELRMNI